VPIRVSATTDVSATSQLVWGFLQIYIAGVYGIH